MVRESWKKKGGHAQMGNQGEKKDSLQAEGKKCASLGGVGAQNTGGAENKLGPQHEGRS